MGTIDLNLLPVFTAVADTSSFSAAAERLGIPKSTVSRGVASLESAMGVRLFHRTTRRVSLSTAGAAIRDRIASSLAALQESLGHLPEQEREPSGRLRVTAAVDFGATVLAEIVARFATRYPGVEVEMRLSNAVVDLVAEGFDVALRISTRALKDSPLVARNVGTIVLQPYASPNYLARRGAPREPSDLADHEWIQFRGAGPLRLRGPDRTVTIEPRGRIVCDDMFFVREVLRHGAGIGMLPAFLAEGDVAAGRLSPVLQRWSVPTGQLWLICHGARPLPRKVTAFRDFVTESLKVRPISAA